MFLGCVLILVQTSKDADLQPARAIGPPWSCGLLMHFLVCCVLSSGRAGAVSDCPQCSVRTCSVNVPSDVYREEAGLKMRTGLEVEMEGPSAQG